MKRVCIVTPGALGSNPRVVKEATALQQAGYDVLVISTRTLQLADDRDQAILDEVSWSSIWLDYSTAGWNKWRLKLWRLWQAVAERLYRLTAISFFADHSCSAFTAPLLLTTEKVQADLYIAHYVAALPAAARAAKRHHAPYAFDAEDFHLGDPPRGEQGDRERKITRAIESRYLPSCAYVTAASPGIAEAYTEAYGIPQPTVVLNVFPLNQAPEAPTPKGTATPGPSLYWFSQTIGPDRGLECAVRAIARAQSKPHLYLRGTPAAGYAGHLKELAEEQGCADRLHLLPPAMPQQMERLAAEYDVGLVGETGHTPNRRICLTNKQFTYLLAGLPVLFSDIPAHRQLANELGDATPLYSVDDEDELAQQLDALLLSSETLSKSRQLAWGLGQGRYNWDVEQEFLLNNIKLLLNCKIEKSTVRKALM